MPETREEIRERVVAIVCEQLNVVQDRVKDETSFVNDFGADSLDTVELAMEFEDEFDIQVDDEESEKLTTVGSAIDLVFWKVNGCNGPHPFEGIKAKAQQGIFKNGVIGS